MTDPIRNALTYLRMHTVEEAIRNNQLPLPRGRTTNIFTQIFTQMFGESDTSARINTFIMGVLGRGVELLQDADVPALRKVYNYPYSSPDQKGRIFQICTRMLFKNISPELREERVREIASDINPVERPDILQAMERISLTEALPLMEGITDGRGLMIFLQGIADLPETQRNTIISSASSLMEGAADEFYFPDTTVNILQTIANLPEAQREAFISLASPFMEKVSSRKTRAHILFTIAKLPEAQRSVITSLAWSLIASSGTIDQNHRSMLDSRPLQVDILWAIAGFPEAQRDALISLVRPVIVGAFLYEIATILKTIEALPEAQRSAVISLALPLMEGVSKYQLSYLLRRIEKLPETQRAGIISLARPLIVGTINGREEILRTIGEIPEAQRAAIISLAFPLMEGIADGYQRSSILRTIQGLPEAQRNAVISLARPLMVGTVNEGPRNKDYIADEQRALILRTIANLPEAQRETIISLASPFMEGILIGKAQILQTIAKFSDAQREAIVSLVLPLVEGIADGSQRLGILYTSRWTIQKRDLIASLDALAILDNMKEEAGNILTLTTLSQALTAKDTTLQHALFERMYCHHVKTGKKQVDHSDYGRAAFLETDPRIVVTKEERQEVIRQVQIEHVLRVMKSSLGIGSEPLISKLEQIDRNTANRLYGKMYVVLQESGNLELYGYNYFGGGEAAFKKPGVSLEERITAIDALALELQAEWL